jgi:hypothetical protein
MPIERCAYCGKMGNCDLWHQACAGCDAAVIKPALERKERFVAVHAGSLRSYPESWLKEQEAR